MYSSLEIDGFKISNFKYAENGTIVGVIRECESGESFSVIRREMFYLRTYDK